MLRQCVRPAEMEDVNTVRNTVKSLLYSDPSHLCRSGKKNYLTVVSKYFHKNVQNVLKKKKCCYFWFVCPGNPWNYRYMTFLLLVLQFPPLYVSVCQLTPCLGPNRRKEGKNLRWRTSCLAHAIVMTSKILGAELVMSLISYLPFSSHTHIITLVYLIDFNQNRVTYHWRIKPPVQMTVVYHQNLYREKFKACTKLENFSKL